jgi:hypothetical protein
VVFELLMVVVSLVAICAYCHRRDTTHLAVIDVTDGSDVDVRLGALKGSGVAPGGVDELCLAPGTQSRLDGVGGLLAQSARCAEESPSERHDVQEQTTPARE